MASTKSGTPKKDDDAVSDMGGMAKDKKKKEKDTDGKKGK